jgi:hypothetical protein
MKNPLLKTESPETERPELTDSAQPNEKPDWQTPKMEDVSEQVMAQPYIRFT